MTDDEAKTALCAQLWRRVEQLFYRGLLDQVVAGINNFGWWLDGEARPQLAASDVCEHEPRCPK